MEELLDELQALYPSLLWPFLRFAAALSTAPAIGEATVPLRARLLLALVLAVAVQPSLPAPPAIPPLSLTGLIAVIAQVLVGALLGMVFHLVVAALQLAGTLVSTQMGLSMAALNDPLNGSGSDPMASLMYLAFLLLFFTFDGHLVVTQVLARSFHVWPVGGPGPDAPALWQLARSVGWIFSAALMLALPLVFATMVVQVGTGFLNRVAPALNLFALGFSVTVVVGLVLAMRMMPALPDQFVRMNTHVLDLLDAMAPAGGPPP